MVILYTFSYSPVFPGTGCIWGVLVGVVVFAHKILSYSEGINFVFCLEDG